MAKGVSIMADTMINALKEIKGGNNTNQKLSKILHREHSSTSGIVRGLIVKGLVDYSGNRIYSITKLGEEILKIQIIHQKVFKKMQKIKKIVIKNMKLNKDINLKQKRTLNKNYRKSFCFFDNLSNQEKENLIKKEYRNILSNKPIILPIKIIKENLNLIGREN